MALWMHVVLLAAAPAALTAEAGPSVATLPLEVSASAAAGVDTVNIRGGGPVLDPSAAFVGASPITTTRTAEATARVATALLQALASLPAARARDLATGILADEQLPWLLRHPKLRSLWP